MRGDPHPGASPRAGTAGALFPRSYSPAAEPGPASANRGTDICIKGAVMRSVPPTEGTRGGGCVPPTPGVSAVATGDAHRVPEQQPPRALGWGLLAAPRSVPGAPSAHREGQGLGDPPLQAPRRDTRLCHQPGDEGKANWRRGDKSQGGISCSRG